MKFKVIFILFNVVIVAAFLIIFLMPLILLGWEYTRIFWAENWFLPIIFVLIMGVLNWYFISNWKLFQLLEQEDWTGLINYLEDKIYERKRMRKQDIRVLVNAYLVTSQIGKIEDLENYIREYRPKLMGSFILLFGLPYLLQNRGEDMEEYFREFLDRGGRDRYWIYWNFAFSLVLQKKDDEAANVLLKNVEEIRDPILKLLYLYLLDNNISLEDEPMSKVRDMIMDLRKNMSEATMEKEIEKSKENVEIVLLSKLIQEAKTWLYSERFSQN